MNTLNWGLIIKELLAQRGMSQAELAKKSGLSEAYISRVCKGNLKDMKRHTLEKLARGLSMSFYELNLKLRGQEAIIPRETPEQLLERFKINMPATIPIYEDHSFHAGEPKEPTDYVAMIKRRVGAMKLEGYIAKGTCLQPDIQEGDIIIIDREGQIDIGNIVACLFGGMIHLGRLRKIADELYLENNNGRIKLTDVQLAAPVVEVRRRLK